MKKIFVFFIFILFSSTVNAQFITNDPIHTGITTLIKMFQDPSFKSIVTNIEKLKKVNSAVRQFHRGTEVVNKISDITTKLTSYSTAIAKDGHIYPVEYKLMSKDIQMFTAEATKLIKDMKTATTVSGGVLQMTDAERARWLDDTFMRVSAFDSKISNYFGRIKSASIQRSSSKADMTATSNLYKMAVTVPKGYFGGGVPSYVNDKGYDNEYNDSLSIPLDYLYKTQAYKDFQKQMRECEFKNQMFYKRQEYEAKRLETLAMQQLLSKGYQMVVKNGFLVSKSTAQSNFNSVMDIVQNETDSYKSINS